MDRLIGAISLALFGVLFLVPAWKIPSDGTGVWAVMRVVFLLFGFILLFYSAAITSEVLIYIILHLLLPYAEGKKELGFTTREGGHRRLGRGKKNPAEAARGIPPVQQPFVADA